MISKAFHKVVFLLFVVFPVSLCSCSLLDTGSSSVSVPSTYRINVEVDAHLQIQGSSFRDVTAGENATFSFIIDSNYSIAQSTEYSVQDATITIPDVRYTRTVFVSSFYSGPDQGKYVLTITNDSAKGAYSVSPQKDLYLEGETVAVTVAAKESERFVCYSFDHYIHHQQKWDTISEPTSFLTTYSFSMTNNLSLFINYQASSALGVTYHGNGGKTIEGQDSLFLDTVINFPHVSPNTLQGSRWFKKDQCTLKCWSTSPDKEENVISLGSRADVSLFSANVLDLYAVWSPWTDSASFQVETLEDGTNKIVSCNSAAKEIVVPEFIGEKKTTVLGSGSFNGLAVETLILPSTLLTIESSSFSNLANLVSFQFFSSLIDLNRYSFSNCPLLTTLKINANTFPKYQNSADRGNLADRYDQCLHLLDRSKPTLFLAGTSTIGYNHNPNDLVAEVQTPINCYNFATLWSLSSFIQVVLIKSLMNAQDKILYSFQETAFSESLLVNNGAIFQWLEGNFDLLKLYDLRAYGDAILSGWNSFVAATSLLQDQHYEDSDYGFKDNGYYLYTSDPVTDTGNKGPVDLSIPDAYCSSEYLGKLAGLFDGLGIINQVLMTWSSYNLNNIVSKDSFVSFEAAVRKILPSATYLDTINDNMYEGLYFRLNDGLHLLSGGPVRMKRWGAAIASKGLL
jgi:hypothetical protein